MTVPRTDTATLARAMRILSVDIHSDDGVANAAIFEAGNRLDEQAREIQALREALDWYAQSSNWRREVRNVGPRVNWTKSKAAFDRGARAKFVLMTVGQK